MMKVRGIGARARQGERGGSVLVVALLVVVGVAMLGACLVQFSASMTRNQMQAVDNKRAFYLAEAGLSEALLGLRMGKSGNVGSVGMPARLGDGILWVEALGTPDRRIVLKSNGLCGGGRASLSIVVERRSESTAALGIFSDGDLVVKSGSVIDAYDSTAPEPEELVAGFGGLIGVPPPPPPIATRVGSNGNIDVQGTTRLTTRIAGDVTPGPDGVVTSGVGVTITGSTAPRMEPIALPEITVPKLDSKGDLIHKSLTPRTVYAGENRYDSMIVGAGAQVIISGPQILVVGSMVLDDTARLTIDTALGSVEIHATEYLNFGLGSTVTTVLEDPSKVRFLISASQAVDRDGDGVVDPPVTINSTGKMYATLYAPMAPIALGNSLELFGAITASSLSLSQGAKLHFDEALLSDDGAGAGNVQLLSWRIIPLPDVPLASLRIDPLVALRLQGTVLTKPADSHQLIDFAIEFADLEGRTRTFIGEETQFNWTQVQTVVTTTRRGDVNFDAVVDAP